MNHKTELLLNWNRGGGEGGEGVCERGEGILHPLPLPLVFHYCKEALAFGLVWCWLAGPLPEALESAPQRCNTTPFSGWFWCTGHDAVMCKQIRTLCPGPYGSFALLQGGASTKAGWAVYYQGQGALM